MTQRLRAESVGVIVTLKGIRNFRKLLRKANEQEFSFRFIEREEVFADIRAETMLMVFLR